MEWVRIFKTETEARSRITKTQLVIVKGERICVAVFQGKFYAVQDACTHNSESLSKGEINYRGEIICPWHNYRFALNTGKACDSSCRDLKTFPVRIDDSGFYLGIY
jgi:nitrite reductase/ring-hydroxylating ferredoxin subunit